MIRSIIAQSRVLKVHTTSRKFCSTLLKPTSDNDSSKIYPPHIEDIVTKISNLTILEVADLNSLLKKKLNIQGTQMMMPMQSSEPVAKVQEPVVLEKQWFNVKLMSFDTGKKVALIKEIKAIFPDMNLVQAKKFVESVPEYIRKEVSKEDAEKIKAACEAVGGVILLE